MDSQLQEYLAHHNIDYKLHTHPPVFTVEQSRNEPSIQNIPGLHTKSLFLKDEKGQFYLVCMPGEKRLNIRALEKKQHVKKLQFGSSEELYKELELTPGSVSIFGIIHAHKTKLLIDWDVWKAPVVGFHPNINTATLEINHAALQKFYDSLISEKEIFELE